MKPLTESDFNKIAEIMDGREFVVLHYGDGQKGYCNSFLPKDRIVDLVSRSLKSLTSNSIKSIGHAKLTNN